MIPIDECFIVQDSEFTFEENAVMNDGLIPQSVLDKATYLPKAIDYYMGVKK